MSTIEDLLLDLVRDLVKEKVESRKRPSPADLKAIEDKDIIDKWEYVLEDLRNQGAIERVESYAEDIAGHFYGITKIEKEIAGEELRTVKKGRALIPLRNTWVRCKCRAKLSKDFFNNPSYKKNPFWLLEWYGKLERYTPSRETLEDALTLDIDIDDYYEKPSKEVVEFFTKWGPLGLFLTKLKSVHTTPIQMSRHNIPLNELPMNLEIYEVLYEASEYPWVRDTGKYIDYWFDYHRDDTEPVVPGDRKNFFRGYFESWHEIKWALGTFQLAATDERILHTGIDPMLQNINLSITEAHGDFQLNYLFMSLLDALYLLLVQKHLSGILPRYCKYKLCGQPFYPRRADHHYCSDRCRNKAWYHRKNKE